MRSLRNATGMALEWLHPDLFKRAHELRGGNDLYATLRWERLSGSLATADSGDGSWTFKRSGFMSTEVTARVTGSDATAASLRPGWLGNGTLVAGGQLFDWGNLGFWQASWGFSRPGGDVLVRFRPKFTLVRRATEVVIEASAWAIPELSLLVTLGWYMMVSMADDSAATMIAMS